MTLRFARTAAATTLVGALAFACLTPDRGVLAAGQGSDAQAAAAVRAAVDAELRANAEDRSIWAYRDHDRTPGKDAVYLQIETTQGTLRRLIELNGAPVSPAQEKAETQRIAEFIHSPAEQARAHKNDAHDDQQAAALLRMLPTAFVWTVASRDAESTTLNFRPNPEFHPPDMEARVMGEMAGQIVIATNGNRIRTLRGALSEDVNIGWGLLGKLNQGGTFDVERRLIAGNHWQITETHVHIGGHALIFKSIGQQDDEVKTDWHPSTSTTLADAARALHAM